MGIQESRHPPQGVTSPGSPKVRILSSPSVLSPLPFNPEMIFNPSRVHLTLLHLVCPLSLNTLREMCRTRLTRPVTQMWGLRPTDLCGPHQVPPRHMREGATFAQLRINLGIGIHPSAPPCQESLPWSAPHRTLRRFAGYVPGLQWNAVVFGAKAPSASLSY